MSNAKTILIVDDSESDRLLCRRHLKDDLQINYLILEASTAQAGLELWQSQNPDVVIVDLNLPGDSGLDLLEAIRGNLEADSDRAMSDLKLPVIILTGSEDVRDAVFSMRLGAFDYLVKSDITKFSLQRSIHNLLDSFALSHQLEIARKRELLISQTALNIRQYLNLNDICRIVVRDVRKAIKADRVLIYKFSADMTREIVAEAVIPPWQSCVDLSLEQICTPSFTEQMQAHADGQVFAHPDISSANLSKCHRQMLSGVQVRANVIVPILLTDNPLRSSTNSNHSDRNHPDRNPHQQILWGQLIVHQCAAPRNWEDHEILLLQELSIQLAIAIQQAEIYQDLQNLNISLSQQVQERTAEIEASEQKLRSLVESIPDIINLVNVDGVCLETKYCKTPYDLFPELTNPIGKKLDELLPQQAAAEQLRAIRQAVRTGEIQIFEQVAIDNELRYEEIRVVPAQADAAIVIARDITERRLAEQALLASESRFQKIDRSCPEIIQIFVQRADGSAYFEYLSSAFEVITELKVEDVLQNPQLAFNQIHNDDIADLGEATRLSLENLTPLQHEWRIVPPSGKIKWLRSNLSPERRRNGDTAWYGVVYDISDRKQMEIILQKEVIRNKTLLNASFDGIVILDSKGNVIESNQSFATMLGYTLEEMHQISIYDIDAKWNREELVKVNQECRIKKSLMFETLHRSKDGKIYNVEVSANSLEWDNDVIGFCICRDVTERKLAEQALRRQEQEVRTLIENSPDVIARYDRDFRLTYVNSAIRQLSGNSPQSYIGKSMREVNLPEYIVVQWEDSLGKVFTTGEPVVIDTKLNGINRVIYSQSRFLPEFDGNGNIVSVMLIWRDFTEQKLAEVALKQKIQQEQLLNRFIQTIRGSLDLRMIFDSATFAIAHLLNLELAAIVEYMPERQIWKHIAVFTDSPELLDTLGLEVPDRDNPFAEKLKGSEIVQINDSEQIEDEINRELAKTKSGAWLMVPIITNYNVWGSLSIQRAHKVAEWESHEIDLTKTIANQIAIALQQVNLYQKLQLELAEHKQTEIALAQAKELAEAANKSKSEFLANMSHEIRTPMNGIVGMAQLLASTPLRNDQKNFIQIILDSGDALLNIINDILDISKIESGNLQLEQKEFNFEDTIASVCKLLGKQASDKNINLQCQISNHALTTVLGDSSRLRQIFINLIGNAIKFTEQGHINISYYRKPITNNIYEFRFSIVDTGIGIDSDRIDKLFTPFTQADASINRQYGGTGLGLAICKRIVELMNGTIWVESRGQVGGKPPLDWMIDPATSNRQGSIFYFTVALPLASDSQISTGQEHTSLSKPVNTLDPVPLKILVVEDNILNQKIAVLMLEKLGYKVDAVNNGRDCLDMFLNQDAKPAYDIIFMDVKMPVMGGLEATQLIRERLSSSTQPWIVAITADVLPHDYEACINVGMNDYISKPITIKDIKRTISQYMNQVPK